MVTLLGEFRLEVEGRDADLPSGAQRLVALIALYGRLSRSRLAGMLWPDSEEHRALARLRTGIWRVNQAGPELVIASGGQIGLSPRAAVDVHELAERSLEVLRGEEFDLTPWTATYPMAELLPGWEDDWLTDLRQRHHQMRLHALETVAERLSATGRFGLAVELALAVLHADALRESAHRALIRVHLAEGNVCEARRAYENCVRVLAKELGVPPTRATIDLVTAFLPTGAEPLGGGAALPVGVLRRT
ncbi:AfsR/SARP family transcriptional regulator [Streptomyces scabiei]|uniref:AfsR/SARP family transcriptional regulator n=1 Tax=Streptomyces scabiei TaxID=1930 RepID=UPI0038F64CCB